MGTNITEKSSPSCHAGLKDFLELRWKFITSLNQTHTIPSEFYGYIKVYHFCVSPKVMCLKNVPWMVARLSWYSLESQEMLEDWLLLGRTKDKIAHECLTDNFVMPC
ncbi:hypothetical protein MLD38_013743 [Melastoma candidum]|uniref:Uncharacterized protein n=1 Tax=Melastoma candidum TaxID=119954 RepID=A0ACB9R9Y7_9MYRT|nr:hypothetical protein MLD38_013743 [Melastoma candidum]